MLGMFAILEPAGAGLGVAVRVAWLLIFGGLAHLIEAWAGGAARSLIFQVVVELISYFRWKRQDRSGWMLFNPHFVARRVDLVHWPSSSTWATGILIGMTLLMTGVTRLKFAMMARKLVR